MRTAAAAVLAAFGACAFFASQLSARAQAPLHDTQYPDADIAYGATIYAARCASCHGAQGDTVGGVNLRTGTFKTAVTDQDLARVIRTGAQSAGMPAFPLDNSEMPASSPTSAT